MTYEAKVIADSVSLAGVRLTTLQITFPRIVLAELNTHRTMSRNSASSRAIPVAKQVERVRTNPFIPEAFCANQKGMQAGAVLDADGQTLAREIWLKAANQACETATALASNAVHKQWANRVLEPYSWHTAIVTATEWSNFFALRCSSEAQPEIRTIAEAMREAIFYSGPDQLGPGAWHTPYVDLSTEPALIGRDDLLKVSVGRCARVSYLTQDGRQDPAADAQLHDRLLTSGHMSPFEHVATPADDDRTFIGNFRGWRQYRKTIPGEACFSPKEER